MITYDPLWRTLINKDMTKTQLREKANFSTVTLAKLSKNEYVSLQIIDNICKALQVNSITEVIEFIGGTGIVKPIANIELLINKLMRNKSSNVKTDDKDIFLLYLVIEDFIENVMNNTTEEDKNLFLNLYSKCFAEKLLPQDLLDALNDTLKKYLF